jgi:hypothetical protein
MTTPSQDDWEDQLLVSEPKPSTPDDAPAIQVRRLNPHGSEAAEARRRREEAIARAERASARSRRHGNPVLLALGAISAVATVWLWVANRPIREPTPAALVGEWTPLLPAYAGARLAFTTSAITISSPAGERATHPIESLRTTPEPDGLLLELTYPSSDGPVTLTATLQEDGPTPRLVFTHPAGLAWEQVSATTAR